MPARIGKNEMENKNNEYERTEVGEVWADERRTREQHLRARRFLPIEPNAKQFNLEYNFHLDCFSDVSLFVSFPFSVIYCVAVRVVTTRCGMNFMHTTQNS